MPAQPHIALLRAVNLGSHLRIDMGRLREALERGGYPGARTWLPTGNVVLPGGRRSGRTLEHWFEELLDREFGARTEVFVRTVSEWQRTLARNPYSTMAREDPAHLVVMFLRSNPTGAAVRAALEEMEGPEQMTVNGREVFVTYPDGIGRSPLGNSVLERRLGVSGTSRNWNTVRKLGELAVGD